MRSRKDTMLVPYDVKDPWWRRGGVGNHQVVLYIRRTDQALGFELGGTMMRRAATPN